MIVVVGAGVVGLAVARALAMRGRVVSVIERHARPGLETSTHNSGVIHAGLYYPAASLKARLCVEGRDRLYAFCRQASVPHMRCGKLVVGQAGDEAGLARVLATATAAGASLVPVDRSFIAAREPHVRAHAGLWSPDTGWLEAEALVRALRADVERHVGIVLPHTDVIGLEPHGPHGLVVVTPRERIEASALVNAAGLYADEIAALAGGEPFRIHPCRGEYAELAPRARGLINGLVYPVPDASGHGLGVHFTRTLGGEVWIGPTVRFQEDKQDYERDRLPLSAFLEPARRLVPALDEADLRLGGSGIRAKLHGPAEPFADFLIRRDTRNAAVIHAAGIESPGLTACLAIGEMVAALAAE